MIFQNLTTDLPKPSIQPMEIQNKTPRIKKECKNLHGVEKNIKKVQKIRKKWKDIATKSKDQQTSF